MRHKKTRTVTEMGRLVTRQQLQTAANQIAAHLVRALEKVQADLRAEHAARFRLIEERLGILPAPEYAGDRTLALMPDVADLATDGGEGDEEGAVPLNAS